MAEKVIATNRKARFNYTILESFEAGIELRGAEVKSLRSGNANLADSFARGENGEIFLHNMHVAPYEFANINNPDPVRPRRLLLRKNQIRRILGEAATRRLALIPLKIYFKEGIVKVELALAKGKKLYDKREAIRRRETERDLRRILRKK